MFLITITTFKSYGAEPRTSYTITNLAKKPVEFRICTDKSYGEEVLAAGQKETLLLNSMHAIKIGRYYRDQEGKKQWLESDLPIRNYGHLFLKKRKNILLEQSQTQTTSICDSTDTEDAEVASLLLPSSSPSVLDPYLTTGRPVYTFGRSISVFTGNITPTRSPARPASLPSRTASVAAVLRESALLSIPTSAATSPDQSRSASRGPSTGPATRYTSSPVCFSPKSAGVGAGNSTNPSSK